MEARGPRRLLPPTVCERLRLAREEARLLGETATIERTDRGIRRRMAAVQERERRIDDHLAAGGNRVDQEGEVLHDVKTLAEADLPDPLGIPRERGEVRPVAVHERNHEVFAAEDLAAVRIRQRRVPRLDGVGQRFRGCAVLVDHGDTAFEDGGVRLGGEAVVHGLQVAGEHDVVGAHHDDRGGLDHAEALAVVAIRAEVDFVLLVGHARIPCRELAHVAGRLGVRETVVDHDEPEVGKALRHDAVDGLLEVVDVSVIRQHHIDGHVGSGSLLRAGRRVFALRVFGRGMLYGRASPPFSRRRCVAMCSILHAVRVF